MMYIIVSVFILYLIAMMVVIIGFLKLSNFIDENLAPQTKFSVIIPFRNEAERLPNLLASIIGLRYPTHLFEVIFVDDASEDDSVAIIETALQDSRNPSEIVFKIIPNRRLSGSPKKDAITEAITIATNKWIITTDADCILPPNWLNAFNACITKHDPKLVAGPVRYDSNTSFVEQFQLLDGLSLQAVTIAGFGLEHPILCNGANLAYTKDAFLEVQGFSENNHIASGDDIFILEKINKTYPQKTVFLKSKNAIVTTFPERNWSAMMDQRIRWASKTTKQNNSTSKALGLLVFMTNLMLIIGMLVCIINSSFIPIFLSLSLLKFLVDFIVLKVGSLFFGSKINSLVLLGSFIAYPFIIVSVVLGSLKGGYQWKGRKFEKQG